MPNVNSYLTQQPGNVNLKDFAHASRLYLDQAFALTPKAGWIYYAVFDIETSVVKDKAWANRRRIEQVGALIKGADLPRYQVNTETVNQYNRKTIIQKSITYSPVSLTMHDDSANTVHNLWLNYYKYYYNDPNLGGSLGTNSIFGTARDNKTGAYGDTKYKSSDELFTPTDYGLKDGANLPFFRSITLYQLSRQLFTSYQLVNPKIKSWDHDRMDQTQGNRMAESKMTLEYEAVFYGSGRVRKDQPTGFAVFQYDNSPSPLGTGRNGILDDIVAGAAEIFGDATGLFNGDGSNIIQNIGSNLLQDVIGKARGEYRVNGYSALNSIGDGVIKGALNGLGLNLNLNLSGNYVTTGELAATAVSVLTGAAIGQDRNPFNSYIPNISNVPPTSADPGSMADSFLNSLGGTFNTTPPVSSILPVTDQTPAGNTVAPGQYFDSLPPIVVEDLSGITGGLTANSPMEDLISAKQQVDSAYSAANDRVAREALVGDNVNEVIRNVTSPQEYTVVRSEAGTRVQTSVSQQQQVVDYYDPESQAMRDLIDFVETRDNSSEAVSNSSGPISDIPLPDGPGTN